MAELDKAEDEAAAPNAEETAEPVVLSEAERETTQQPGGPFRKPPGTRILRSIRRACMDGEPVVTTGVLDNTAEAATGLLQLKLGAKGRTKYPEGKSKKDYQPLFARGKAVKSDGKFCFCECLKYRQFLKAKAWYRQPGDSEPRPYRMFKSGYRVLAADGALRMEGTKFVMGNKPDGPKKGGDNPDQLGCTRKLTDTPGWTKTKEDEELTALRYNFRLQAWDACENAELWNQDKTLTITGDRDPRSIVWTDGWSPLGLTDIKPAASTPAPDTAKPAAAAR